MNQAKVIFTYHLHIRGVVQGVGFRPHVYRLAIQAGICGRVRNSPNGVHIEYAATEAESRRFAEILVRKAPARSRITSYCLCKIPSQKFEKFEIVSSKPESVASVMLTPDFGVCAQCKKELHDPFNRRYQYPFITCTECGPRYSIISALPYDRENTTMKEFSMCNECLAEYNKPVNSRYYSQTNSCRDCGIMLNVYDKTGRLDARGAGVIDMIVEGLKDGKIIAVKGIGGYLLITDADNSQSVKTLRIRKHRPSKPFALMFPDLAAIELVAYVSATEVNALQSVEAPIVLVRAKGSDIDSICKQDIAPRLSRIGAMLPYAPIFDLILSRFGAPIVATSANFSESPIIFDDDQALATLFDVADLIVTNNRGITVPQDDSVVEHCPFSGKRIILRRSRGMAPSYFGYRVNTEKTVLATGAFLKSSFTYVNKRVAYVSQYLGSTGTVEAQKSYSHTIQHFFTLFNAPPEIILSDLHEGYFSNQFAKELGKKLECRVMTIQHHKAHFAAVLAENNLISQSDAVLGVIWDGTGLGDDGNIWGGEFFIYRVAEIRRAAHLGYFPFILGDKMPREPRISALTQCIRVASARNLLERKFTKTEWHYYRQLIDGATVKCSSIGRLFDAVSSLLGLCDKQSYEGESALMLQEQAGEYFEREGWGMREYYSMETESGISGALLLEEITRDISRMKTVPFMAAKFHFSLVRLVKRLASQMNVHKIAFAGGVFVNRILVDLLEMNLGKQFELFFHRELSPNDESISFGQFVYFDNNFSVAQSEKNYRSIDRGGLKLRSLDTTKYQF